VQEAADESANRGDCVFFLFGNSFRERSKSLATDSKTDSLATDWSTLVKRHPIKHVATDQRNPACVVTLLLHNKLGTILKKKKWMNFLLTRPSYRFERMWQEHQNENKNKQTEMEQKKTVLENHCFWFWRIWFQWALKVKKKLSILIGFVLHFISWSIACCRGNFIWFHSLDLKFISFFWLFDFDLKAHWFLTKQLNGQKVKTKLYFFL